MAKSQIVGRYVEFNTMFCGNSRLYKGKNKNGYYKAPSPPLNGYHSEIRFWAQENMSTTSGGKMFYQHTVT